MIKKTNVIKLIEAYNNNDDKVFKEYSYKIAKELGKAGEDRLEEHVMAITSGLHLWSPQMCSPLPEFEEKLKKLAPFVVNDYHKTSIGIFYNIKEKKFQLWAYRIITGINGIRFEDCDEVENLLNDLLEDLNSQGGFTVYEFEKLCCKVFGKHKGEK